MRKNLKEARQAAGMTQQQMADKVGIRQAVDAVSIIRADILQFSILDPRMVRKVLLIVRYYEISRV